MLGEIEIHRPASVEEASRLLRDLGSAASIYAGGTELLVVMKERIVHYPHLIDVKTIPGLDAIRLDGDHLVIGALATHRRIERHPLVLEHAPLLARLEADVANIRVRSTGTIGGNLCFAEPHSDPATMLVAWDASFILVSASGSRSVSAERFFTGILETDRLPDEIMTEIRIPLASLSLPSAYERFKIHERPTATVAATLRFADGAIAEARIVVGGVGDRPRRMRRAEAHLHDAVPATDRFAEAADLARAEIEPTEDAFESTDYKRHLVRVLTGRALANAAERAHAAKGDHGND